MNKLLRKFTAVVLAASVALGGVSFGALDLSAWAAVSDGIQTALDIGQGSGVNGVHLLFSHYD